MSNQLSPDHELLKQAVVLLSSFNSRVKSGEGWAEVLRESRLFMRKPVIRVLTQEILLNRGGSR